MKKIGAMTTNSNRISKEPKLTIGLDLGGRSSHYCILDEAGNVILERNLPTTAKGIHQVFSRIPRSRIALETGAHSPWVNGICHLLRGLFVGMCELSLIGARGIRDSLLFASGRASRSRVCCGCLSPLCEV
jgi:transposase